MRTQSNIPQPDAFALMATLIGLIATVNLACAQPLQPEVLYRFHAGPSNPNGGLVQGSDGNFYGTMQNGGSGGAGIVFRVTTNGVLTTLAAFATTNGASPGAALTLGHDGNLYGTTPYGGVYSNHDGSLGTVFQVTTNGVLTTLVSFAGTNGAEPRGAMTLGNDGNFYGTTEYGGAYTNQSVIGFGTVFRVTTNGLVTTLVSFNGTNGGSPFGGLTLGNDGSFYGMTELGYNSEGGTVFRVTTGGVLTTLVSFSGTNGWEPNGLVLGNDGNFYGTTYFGGMGWTVGGFWGEGTVFRVTTNGELTTLVLFTGTNGSYPNGGLTLGSDGNFYGTTRGGGAYTNQNGGFGTVFR